MSLYIDSTAGAIEHCENMITMYNDDDDIKSIYKDISSYVTNKLWHQLTLKVLNVVKNPSKYLRITSDPPGTNSFLALYDKVICSVDKKLNSLSLSIIAVYVSNSLLLEDVGVKDGMAAKTILENLLTEKKQQLGTPATIYLESKLALLNLTLLEKNIILINEKKTTDDDDKMKVDDSTATAVEDDDDSKKTKLLSSIKEMLKKNSSILSEMVVSEKNTSSTTNNTSSSFDINESSIVQSSHYECSMTYYKVVGPPEAFYREAISYLNYTNIDILDKDVRYKIATDISLAALTGDGVFNFGEVITSLSILDELKSTDNEYLVELMYVASKGDVIKFNDITNKYSKQIQSQPVLINRSDIIKEKITLLALVNMIFERSSSERTITFDDIVTRINNGSNDGSSSTSNTNIICKGDVELIIMRALSLKLITGYIDEIDETLEVVDVMSRVLDNDQITNLASKFGTWAVKVSNTKDYMKEQISPII